jgi:hypothetical protein
LLSVNAAKSGSISFSIAAILTGCDKGLVT